MTKKEKLKLLQDWENQFHVTDKAWKCLKLLFGDIDCDSEIGKAIWGSFTEYSRVMAMLLGDKDEWLSWYCWENDMGMKEHKARPGMNRKMRKIKTLKDLLWLIEVKHD